MYLFVFIFVIMSVLGLYTELFSLRMANFASRQKFAAEAMVAWHDGVSSFVTANRASISTIPTLGCPIAMTITSTCGLPTFNKGVVSGRVYIPDDYNPMNSDQLKFRSVLYKFGTNFYVLTYLNPDEFKLGYTADQVHQQLFNAKLTSVSYGRVMTGACVGGTSGHWLATKQYALGVQVCYGVPTSLLILDDSVGVVTNIGS